MNKIVRRIVSIFIVISVAFGLINSPVEAIFEPTITPGSTQGNQLQGWNLNYLGQTGGFINASAVIGNYAYVAEGTQLTVLDITDPVSPLVVSRSLPFPGMVMDVASSGNYVYIADQEGGLRIVDVSTPNNPYEVGFYDSPGSAYGVAIVGNYAFLADFDRGLRIIVIADPSNPFEIGHYDTPGEATSITVVGGYAYIADGLSGLQIINVNNPANPIPAGVYDSPGRAYDVVVSGIYAYIADWNSLRKLDVSDPNNPIYVTGWVPSGTIRTVTYSSGWMYMAADNRLLIIDDIPPYSSTGEYYAPDTILDIKVSGDYAYVSDEQSGLRALYINDPSTPIESGAYENLPGSYSHAVSGEYAYVVSGMKGFHIIDISDATNPVQISSINMDGYTLLGLDVSGSYAYVTDWNGLTIIDVSNPSSPFIVGYEALDYGVRNVVVNLNYAYVAWHNDLVILDITNPIDPVYVGLYTADGEIKNITIQGDYAYIAATDGGLQIVDITNPTSPIEIGIYNSVFIIWDVDVEGNYAYLAAEDGGLRIIDVSYPPDPVEVGFYDSPGLAYGTFKENQFVYLADGAYGLRVIDVSNPQNPSEVNYFSTSGTAQKVTTLGDYIYISAWQTGFYLLEYVYQNLPPVAIDDIGEGFITDEDNPFLTTSVFNNDTDPDGDPLTLDSYDDDATLGLLVYAGEGEFTYAPNGEFDWLTFGEEALDTFSYVVSDGVLTDTATVTITINGVNDIPIVDAGEDQEVNVGQEVFFNGSFIDPDWSGGTYEWDFGDGGTADGTLTPTHTFLELGVFHVILTITDDQGGIGSDEMIVTVGNASPIVEAGENQMVDEGDKVYFNGNFTDPNWNGGSILWDFGDGITATETLTPTHLYGDNNIFTVTLTVTDTFGGSGIDWLIAVVNNVPPEIYGLHDIYVEPEDSFTVTGTLFDPGWLDTHQLTIVWLPDDIDYIDLDVGITEFSVDYSFPGVGQYPVIVIATDDDGGSVSTQFTVNVVNEFFSVYLPVAIK